MASSTAVIATSARFDIDDFDDFNDFNDAGTGTAGGAVDAGCS